IGVDFQSRSPRLDEGGAVDWARRIVGLGTWYVVGVAPWMTVRTASPTIVPRPWTSTVTTLKGGLAKRATAVSSQAMTDSWPGIATPRSLAAARPPIAIRSLS